MVTDAVRFSAHFDSLSIFSLNNIAAETNGCSLFPEYCHGQGCVCVLIKPPLFPLVSVYGRSSEVDHGKRS